MTKQKQNKQTNEQTKNNKNHTNKKQKQTKIITTTTTKNKPRGLLIKTKIKPSLWQAVQYIRVTLKMSGQGVNSTFIIFFDPCDITFSSIIAIHNRKS